MKPRIRKITYYNRLLPWIVLHQYGIEKFETWREAITFAVSIGSRVEV